MTYKMKFKTKHGQIQCKGKKWVNKSNNNYISLMQNNMLIIPAGTDERILLRVSGPLIKIGEGEKTVSQATNKSAKFSGKIAIQATINK